MCGFSVLRSDDPSFPTSILWRILHRGLPGQSKIIVSQDKILHHTRLPIQTLPDDQWSQPIEIEEGKFLLYNGELFRYPGMGLHYENDVDYLAGFFSRFGTFSRIISPEALEEINAWDGFWSIALVSAEGTVAFTDPLGKKQLYYDDSDFDLSSEVKTLAAKKRHLLEIDQKTISSILKFGYNTDDRTCFSGIKRIVPNSIYFFPAGRSNTGAISRFDDYFSWKETPTESEYSVKEILYQSVMDRLVSKTYPIGVLLSGGLDSTIITSILEDMGIRNIQYYSIENGEKEYVDIVSQYFGIGVNYLEYPKEMFSNPDLCGAVLYYNDSPIDMGSLFLQHSIMSVIPEKIVLTGDGADELFGGYRRINEYDSQKSDIFDELPYYHLPRLDRASMRYTIELRSPFLSHSLVRKALNSVPFEARKSKVILKSLFKDQIPPEILERSKKPLKSKNIVEDPLKERKNLCSLFERMVGESYGK